MIRLHAIRGQTRGCGRRVGRHSGMIRGSVVVQWRRCGKANCRRARRAAARGHRAEPLRGRAATARWYSRPASWRRCGRWWLGTGPRRLGLRKPAPPGQPRRPPVGRTTAGAGERVDSAAGMHPRTVFRTPSLRCFSQVNAMSVSGDRRKTAAPRQSSRPQRDRRAPFRDHPRRARCAFPQLPASTTTFESYLAGTGTGRLNGRAADLSFVGFAEPRRPRQSGADASAGRGVHRASRFRHRHRLPAARKSPANSVGVSVRSTWLLIVPYADQNGGVVVGGMTPGILAQECQVS
jgi:hypothetical protein